MRHAAKRETRFARHVFVPFSWCSQLCETSSKFLFKNAKVTGAVDEKSTLHGGPALAKCKMREAKTKEIKVKIDEPTGS